MPLDRLAVVTCRLAEDTCGGEVLLYNASLSRNLCVIWCCFILPLVVNPLPQTSHLNGLSLVCERMCISRALLQANTLKHSWQVVRPRPIKDSSTFLMDRPRCWKPGGGGPSLRALRPWPPRPAPRHSLRPLSPVLVWSGRRRMCRVEFPWLTARQKSELSFAVRAYLRILLYHNSKWTEVSRKKQRQ
jgi:hypothetical protein